MRLPRDVSGPALAAALAEFGYRVTRQTGSHMRLTTTERGEHHVTMPVFVRSLSVHEELCGSGTACSSHDDCPSHQRCSIEIGAQIACCADPVY